MSTPAVLGGTPVFEPPVPFMRPTLPGFSEVSGELREIFQTGMVTKGHFLAEFEAALAAYLGVKHAVGVSSCTTGLALTYKAADLTGEVIVPSFTFMATVHPLSWCGLTPVFADVDPDTWNLDPSSAEAAVTPNTSAVIATHVFGNPATIDVFQQMALRKGIKLLFDAAHGFGTLYRGEPVGRYGVAEVFSSSPTKLLVTGEGGVVATDGAEIARRVEVGREYGNPGNYNTEFPGLNARMQEFSAILGLHSLQTLDENAERRNHLVDVYREGFREVAGIYLQKVDERDRCSYKDFTIRVVAEEFGLSRDALVKALRTEGIDTRNYYDPPVHLHTAYKHLADQYRGKLPVTERLAKECVSLPIYSHMRPEVAVRVCEAIHRIQRHGPAVSAVLS